MSENVRTEGHFSGEDLKAFCDGELPWSRRLILRRHLAHCADCRQEVLTMRQLHHDLVRTDSLPGAFSPALRARILAELDQAAVPVPAQAGRPQNHLLRYGIAAAVAANALLVFVVSRSALVQQPRQGNAPVSAPLAAKSGGRVMAPAPHPTRPRLADAAKSRVAASGGGTYARPSIVNMPKPDAQPQKVEPITRRAAAPTAQSSLPANAETETGPARSTSLGTEQNSLAEQVTPGPTGGSPSAKRPETAHLNLSSAPPPPPAPPSLVPAAPLAAPAPPAVVGGAHADRGAGNFSGGGFPGGGGGAAGNANGVVASSAAARPVAPPAPPLEPGQLQFAPLKQDVAARKAPPVRLKATPPAAGAIVFGAMERATPELIGTLPPPELPPDFDHARVKSPCVLTVEVAADGHVSGVRLKRSSGSATYDEACQAAIRRALFQPAIKDHTPRVDTTEVRYTDPS